MRNDIQVRPEYSPEEKVTATPKAAKAGRFMNLLRGVWVLSEFRDRHGACGPDSRRVLSVRSHTYVLIVATLMTRRHELGHEMTWGSVGLLVKGRGELQPLAASQGDGPGATPSLLVLLPESSDVWI